MSQCEKSMVSMRSGGDPSVDKANFDKPGNLRTESNTGPLRPSTWHMLVQ